MQKMGAENGDGDGWCSDGLTLDGEVVTFMERGWDENMFTRGQFY